MSKIVWIFLFCLACFYIQSIEVKGQIVNNHIKVTPSVPGYKDTTYIGLFLDIKDHVTNSSRKGILLIGKCKNGKYWPIDDGICENSLDLSKTQSQKILINQNEFAVYKYGSLLTKVRTNKLQTENFACSLLPIGSVESTSFTLIDSNDGYKGKSGNKKIDFSFDFLLALSKTVTQRTSYSPIALSATITQKAYKNAQNHLLDSLKLRNMSAKTIELKGLTNGKDTLLSLRYHFDTKNNCVSSTQIYLYRKSKLQKQLELNSVNEVGSWGSGYELLDVIDIDGDGAKEIVFKVGYYESTGFEIYKLKNGVYQSVMDLIAWGC